MYFLSFPFLKQGILKKIVSVFVMIGVCFSSVPTFTFAASEQTSSNSNTSEETTQEQQTETEDSKSEEGVEEDDAEKETNKSETSSVENSQDKNTEDVSEESEGEEEQDVSSASSSSSEKSSEQEGEEKESGSSAATTTVKTGDANSSSQVINEANNSRVVLEATSSASTTKESTGGVVSGSSTSATSSALEEAQKTLDDALDQVQNGTNTDSKADVFDEKVEYTGENTVSATNTASTTADTGANTASSTSDHNAAVKTGDANAFASFLNKLNTTEINSSGIIEILNGNGFSGEVDLSQGFSKKASQELSELVLQNINEADLLNTVAVTAQTGKNSACSAKGGAGIETGDANAGANIVNLVNNTFIESKYALLSANILGDFIGDIILPGKSFFKEDGAKKFESFLMNNSNNADISVEGDISSDTGGNEVEGNDGNTQTGESVSSSVISNDVNSVGVGGDAKVKLIFNVLGEMNGGIYSLPEGVALEETETGFTLYSKTDSNEEESKASTTVEKEVVTSENSQKSASSTVSSTSTVISRTQASVKADTGDNIACGGDGSDIKTGNAMSGLVVLGLYNTTFYGKNLIYGAVNIFGDLNGNISFGRPDLWIGGQADVETTSKGAFPGSTVKYTYTLYNHGDADATEVEFTDQLGQYLSFASSEEGQANGEGEVEWHIDSIPAGESVEVSYSVQVDSKIPYGQTYVTNKANVEAHEPDTNMNDNTEEISIPIYRHEARTNGNLQTQSNRTKEKNEDQEANEEPELVITKTNNASATTTASSTVWYKIVIKNNGGKAYESVVEDILTDENGNIIFNETWNLETIQPDEEITLEYAVFYDQNTPSGVYTNEVHIDYTNGDPKLPKSKRMVSEISVSNVVIRNKKAELEALIAQSREAIAKGKVLARKINNTLSQRSAAAGKENQEGESLAANTDRSSEHEKEGRDKILANASLDGEDPEEMNLASVGTFFRGRWEWLALTVLLFLILFLALWQKRHEKV